MCLLVLGLFLLEASAAHARKTPWAKVKAPSAEAPESFGGYANGCLAGGVALPARGEGFETIRRWRNRYYAHPAMAILLKHFTKSVLAETGVGVLIGDISQARGGLMGSGHRSHQLGLDADVWFTRPDQRGKDRHFVSMVRRDREAMNLKAWTNRQETLLRLAAQQPQTARVFVHWVIKQHLCKTVVGDRSWLRKIRPWYGHDRHFHIRMQCPKDNPQCRNQKTLPPGDACGGEVWFSHAQVRARKKAAAAARKAGKRGPRRKPKVVPQQCKRVLAAPSRSARAQ